MTSVFDNVQNGLKWSDQVVEELAWLTENSMDTAVKIEVAAIGFGWEFTGLICKPLIMAKHQFDLARWIAEFNESVFYI